MDFVGLAEVDGAGLVTVTVTTGAGVREVLLGRALDVLDACPDRAGELGEAPAVELGAGLVGVAVAAGAVGLGAGGGGATLAAAGEPSTVTEPSALSRRKAGFGLGTSP